MAKTGSWEIMEVSSVLLTSSFMEMKRPLHLLDFYRVKAIPFHKKASSVLKC
jgi:hypothetical protein